MVHRELQTVLEMNACGLSAALVKPTKEELDNVEAQCTDCNVMKKKSREAQESCDVAFFCIYLRNRHEINITTGTVMSITEKCFNVFVPKINKDCPVFFTLHAKAPEWFMAGDPKRVELDAVMAGPAIMTYVSESLGIVQWTNTSERIKVSLFDIVKLVIVPLDSVPISFAIRLLPPSNPRFNDVEEPSHS
jgi:hypothetical protein